MKKLLNLSIPALLFLNSCGNTGHIVFYDLDNNKYTVEMKLLNVINKDSFYVVPSKWEFSKEGDIFERIYVYFKNNPEEMYRIGFTGDSAVWKNSSNCRLGLISQWVDNGWNNESDLSRKEKERIQERFEREILSKIKYRYIKSE